MGLSIIENCCFEKLKRKDNFRVEEEDSYQQQQPDIEPPSLLLQALSLCCTCLCVSFILLCVFLLAGWLQSTFGYSAIAMLSPVIIVISFICCVCICCVYPIYGYLVHFYNQGDEFELPKSSEHENTSQPVSTN